MFSLLLVIVTCIAMSFALRSAAIGRLVLDASLLHCTRDRPTLLNFADQSFCWMRNSVFSFLFCLLPCTVFLLNAAVFADLALYLAVCGLASVELSCSLTSLSLSQARLLSARDLQHRTWRQRCLLEVGLRYVLDLAASHHLGHLCLSLHLQSHCSFLCNLDLFLILFDITSTRSFQGVRISSGTLLLWNSRCKFRLVFALKSHSLRATERQCLVPKAEIQSCW